MRSELYWLESNQQIDQGDWGREVEDRKVKVGRKLESGLLVSWVFECRARGQAQLQKTEGEQKQELVERRVVGEHTEAGIKVRYLLALLLGVEHMHRLHVRRRMDSRYCC